jgi:hypothetical protein
MSACRFTSTTGFVGPLLGVANFSISFPARATLSMGFFKGSNLR